MSNSFDSLIEGQKKAWDLWTETSKKALAQFEQMNTTKAPKQDMLGDWFKMQKQMWEQAAKITQMPGFEQSPEQMQRWAKMQTEYAQNWLKLYMQNAANPNMGMNMPMAMPGAFGMTAPNFGQAPKEWQDWMNKTNTWLKDNILVKLPFPQGFHYQNFNSLYEGMYQYWEPIQRMMQSGITDWKGIEMFMKPDAYKEIVGMFMGFKPTGDISGMLKQANDYFEQYGSWFKQMGANPGNWQEQWQQLFDAAKIGQGSPNMLHAILDINNTVRDGLESLYNVAGQTKEVEMAKLIKDIQFTYIAFIIKTVEMQSKVLNASQYALPDTMKRFSKQLAQGSKMPDYQTFFNEYINDLEVYMIQTLQSQEYSIIQSEVAKAGITVKSKLDKLVELAMSDLPFLMQSHSDEVAVETSALRAKVRKLEHRLAALESQMRSSNNAAAAPAKKEKAATAPKPAPKAEAPKAEANVPNPQETLLAFVGMATPDQKDDLTKIKGIGTKLEELLNNIGIYTFEQMSKMSDAQYQLVDQLISAFQGRAQRDKWAEQARQFI